jgi:hypothetical protein
MRPTLLLAALALTAAAASCAPVPSPTIKPGLLAQGPRQCFFASTISGFRESGPNQVNFRVGAGDVYQLDLATACGDLRGAEKVLLDSRAAGSSVCEGLDVDLIVPAAAGPRRCPGRGIRKLNPAEVAALPSAQRP